jgi:DNA-binding MarR family transcriptional regulator
MTVRNMRGAAIMGRKLSPTPPALEIERVLHRKPGYLIRRLQQIAVSIFLKETDRFDVTPIQYATLAAVNVYPGIDQLRTANAIGVDRATISGVIDRLVTKGLIVKKVSGSDGRANQLFSTAKGSNLLADMEGPTNRVQDKILAPLAVGEQTVFLEYLNRLILSHNHSSRVPVDRALIPARAARKARRRTG